MRQPHIPSSLALLIFGVTASAIAADEPSTTLSFNRDVRPILSDKCFACHGFDPEARKADLRLDTPEGANAEIDGVRAIVPGDLQKSEAWLRIVSENKDEVMPPPKSHKSLSAAEKDTIRRWIIEGAKYQRHWSLETPQRAPVPSVHHKAWVRNPLDAFVLAALEKAGLQPAPEADRRTLARRLSLDVTGLPPSPETVESFVNDPAPDAYENLVQKLMDSPQWGEHRARYWLDAARYSDTHGIHVDAYREIWPYRDWVIAAFNRNQRFDEFTLEQLAGDLLPKPTRAQLVATGFHRCNITTSEGGTIDAETLAMYANDRVTTTSWVWLGLTANCAACHDHKFDPITQRDFYSMAAFFRNTTQAAMDGNAKDTKPVVYLPEAKDEARLDELPALIEKTRASLQKRRTEAQPAMQEWLKTAKPEQADIGKDALVARVALRDGVLEPEATAKEPLEWRDGGRTGQAPVLNANASIELGDVADFDKNKPFAVAAWVNTPTLLATPGTIAGRLDDRKGRQGWELFVQGRSVGLQIFGLKPDGFIRTYTRGTAVEAGKWVHVLAMYDGSGTAGGVQIFLNGRPQSLITQGEPLQGNIRASVPLRVGRRETKSPLSGGLVQDVRVFSRRLSPGEARWLPELTSLQESLALAPDKRSQPQKAALQNYFLDVLDTAHVTLAREVDSLESELAGIRARTTVSHIQQEKPGTPMANILMRGAYDKVGEAVGPAGFSALHPMPADAPPNRLGLARWLMAPENPLTARVTVNRFCQEVFGNGLVKTAEDFGSQGERPINQELLDWLAVEFRESGWDVKRLFTLLLTSATYRQSSKITPDKLEKDPHNRLLSRGPRFRMDAEMIRDYALAASGSLSPKMGGPGTKPYQPANIWEVVGLGNARYVQDTGENLYRRTIYNFWKRQAPSPNMEIFNAPARESCTVRRERTNTPLQALVTLNDPQFVEAARQLAERALQDGGDPNAILSRMFSRVLLRPPSAAEAAVVNQCANTLEKQFVADPERTKAFLAIGESKADPTLPPTRLAALAMVASQLLNLDEALNK
ncbi:MAG: hypothetical protein RLZZ399_2689 [Verrucomicrobiota bacterium]|jgi:hypothetical protein